MFAEPGSTKSSEDEHMIVRNFEYLIALNREGHYGRAAQSCNVSQPTLSAGIKQLEKDLDTQIVRHGKRYDGLTKEGPLVLASAQQMHEDCKGLQRELSALHRGIEGPFRLGVLPGMSAVAPILSVALLKKIPLLEQSISTADSLTLSACLKDGALDIAFAYLEDFIDDNFDTHLLYRERIFAFRSNIELQPRSVTWNHVAKLPLCLLNSAIPRSAQKQLAQCARAIYTDSLEVLVAHVASGKYATVLPQSLAARLKQTPHLQALAVMGSGAQAGVGFVATRRGLESTTSHALLEMVHTEEVASPIQALLAVHHRLHHGKTITMTAANARCLLMGSTTRMVKMILPSGNGRFWTVIPSENQAA